MTFPQCAYTDPDAVRAYKVSGDPVDDLIKYTDAEITTEIQIVSETIELITGDWFCPVDITEFLDGNGVRELFFPPIIPAQVITLPTILEVDSDKTTVLTTWEVDKDYKLHEHYVQLIFWNDFDDDARQVGRFGNNSLFARGERNIKIEGSFGRATTPEIITRAAILMTIEGLLPGQSGMTTAADVSQAVWSDFTITYRGDIGEARGMTTGYPQIDRMLQGFVNYSSLFLVDTTVRTPSDESPFES